MLLSREFFLYYEKFSSFSLLNTQKNEHLLKNVECSLKVNWMIMLLNLIVSMEGRSECLPAMARVQVSKFALFPDKEFN
jgi:hypothetical protein